MGYQLFSMCPFAVAKVGGGGSFDGVGSESYVWTHYSCLEQNCRLWVYKVDEEGKVYAQGCSFQFMGANKGEINKNFEIKNKFIKEENERIERINRGDCCDTCKHIKKKFFDNPICLFTDKVVDKKFWCEKFERI